MKILRSLAVPLAALSLAAGAIAAPVAGASEVSPADVAQGAELATITQPESPNRQVASRDWYQKTKDNDRVVHLQAYSPSMGREIPIAVITPEDNSTPRPTLYMLNGAGGAEQNMDWISMSPILDVYEDKNVNVVIPMEGAFSYYTDWRETPGTGYLDNSQLWETFLTKELPGPLEEYLGASHERGIAGMSMSATSALLLAEHNPGFYDAVGSYSGCAATSDPVSRLMAELTVNRGGGTVDQMWGPMGDPNTYHNDALINAEGLRGSEVYVSNASGLAGATDLPGYYIERGIDPSAASSGAATLIIEGGIIEAATNTCTHNLKAKMDSLDIPADWNFRPTGTHSWTYWNQDLWDSWPTFDRAFTTDE
ncbi:alpha/beta hydrolase [Corynebacterium halotolerans]|uniref:Trehalose corynomycolyl transferase A n=1 Tax=Corynebacterium halotolerans YIM 70093 = DSM 44683 TaxID=1121362 RepID=M1MUG8_9CORY|nr:alpha/beta hydrolase family protein [Corynebacterium halotolerans]AGF71389.1 trehalose corynomycolyl transferase A [Corynebacterium halotolerans YIM 70093 = DSM 44683]